MSQHKSHFPYHKKELLYKSRNLFLPLQDQYQVTLHLLHLLASDGLPPPHSIAALQPLTDCKKYANNVAFLFCSPSASAAKHPTYIYLFYVYTKPNVCQFANQSVSESRVHLLWLFYLEYSEQAKQQTHGECPFG